MAKFIIECPRCGTYQEASTGFFSKKILDCKCGKQINVKKDRFSIKECPHCGNTVLYDQAKGDTAICPVCHKHLITEDSKRNFVQITCPSCSCELTVNKNDSTYTCPLCKNEIDVQNKIEKEKIQAQGLASVVKYEGGSDVLVWKHPIEDFNLGSQLIVHESQEAIFFRDGKALDCFGAGRYTLATQKLPILNELYKLPVESNVFHSEVYFVNLVTQTGIKWGTDSKVRMFDPASGLHVELGACGEFNIRVCNSRKLLLKLVGTSPEINSQDVLDQNGFGVKTLTNKFRALIVSKVKSILPKTIKDNSINVLEVDEHIDDLSSLLRVEINRTLEDYGLTLPEFYVTTILTPDDDPNFRRMKEQYAEEYLLVRNEKIKKDVALAARERKIVEAQTDAQEEIIAAQAKAEAYRLKAQAEAQEMQMKGYTYQDETKRQVSLSAMENLPQGGASGVAAGVIGDIVGLGVTMGAVGSVIDMTKDAIKPISGSVQNAVGHTSNESVSGWNCSCGKKNIATNFCPNCGSKKPEEPKGWDCSCGQKNITTNFCPNCGSKKPEEPKGWDCSCGQKNITTNFCPNCGSKKPEEPKGWNCSCGQKNIMTNFCPNCGTKKA